ncbi:MAG: hypothetical protein ACXWTY_13200 [Methylobacter sp.]
MLGKSFDSGDSPPRIEMNDGSFREYYPGANEELVEDALRKIAAAQRCGFYQPDNQRGGVVFSLHHLRQELARRGHTRSYQQIMLSLDILSFANIDIRSEHDKEVKGLFAAIILPDFLLSHGKAWPMIRMPKGWFFSIHWQPRRLTPLPTGSLTMPE